jgi:hypothetical protein
MLNSIILKIITDKENIKIVAKSNGELSVNTIELKLLLAHFWWEGLPILETFFKVFEKTIKKSIDEVYKDGVIFINYDYYTNDLLDHATKVRIQLNQVNVDNSFVKIIGNVLLLEGMDERGFFEKISSFRRKVHQNIQKTLD